MKDDKYKAIFSSNLKRYMQKNEKTQIDLITDLHLDKSTVSTWVNGTRLPRMDKVQMLADYFRIQKSDLIEDKTTAPASPVPAAPQELTEDARSLLDDYRRLNDLGQAEARKRVQELTEIEKYTEDTISAAS